MLLLLATCYFLHIMCPLVWHMYVYWDVFIVGIAVTRATVGNNAIISANTLDEYSYVNTIDSITTSQQIARCVTGLGPDVVEDNRALGGLYFNGSRMPFSQCSDSSLSIISRAAGLNNLGVINVIQCADFSTRVEGIYTCIMINSSMINDSFRFGIYFTGRSESHNL